MNESTSAYITQISNEHSCKELRESILEYIECGSLSGSFLFTIALVRRLRSLGKINGQCSQKMLNPLDS